MNAVERVLRRERAVVAVGIALLIALSAQYLWRGAGTGMSALDMTRAALFPSSLPEPMPGMESPPFAWPVVLAMWWVMMVAMMSPGAAPLLLLYGRAARHAVAQGHAPDTYASTAFLAAGYLAAWLVFAALATAAQAALLQASLLSPMMLWSRSAPLSASVLLLAGVYQFSPLKRACLTHCRGPITFLTRHWRPGRTGALRMGLLHGAWCVGCCAPLMALLFVGGVMNVLWIAALALLVLAEKVLPWGVTIGRVAGALLIVWGVATLFP